MKRPFLFQDIQFRDIEPLIFDYFDISNYDPIEDIVDTYKKLSFINKKWNIYIKYKLKKYYGIFGNHKIDKFQKLDIVIKSYDVDLIKYILHMEYAYVEIMLNNQDYFMDICKVKKKDYLNKDLFDRRKDAIKFMWDYCTAFSIGPAKNHLKEIIVENIIWKKIPIFLIDNIIPINELFIAKIDASQQIYIQSYNPELYFLLNNSEYKHLIFK